MINMARIRNNMVLSVALLMSGPGAVFATVTDNVEYRYYDISPKTPEEIQIEMTRQSPLKRVRGAFNTRTIWARTDWEVKWSYLTIGNIDRCQIDDVKVRAHIVYNLPRLSQDVSDQNTIEAFNRYLKALTAHERTHAQNGINAARDIEKAMNKIPPQRDCLMIARITKRIGKHYINKYVYEDQRYDYMTHNGDMDLDSTTGLDNAAEMGRPPDDQAPAESGSSN